MKKGELIFWEISQAEVSKQELVDKGYAHLVPRNDYRSAIIKALKVLTKGNDKLYRRFNDVAESVSFGVFTEDHKDMNITRECKFSIDKEFGEIEDKEHTMDPEFYLKLKEAYDHAKKSLDSNQFRAFVLRMVKRECFGISMRRGGGIYFIDNSLCKNIDTLRDLFKSFDGATLRTIPIYDDLDSLEAIEGAVSESIFGDISSITKEIQEHLEKGTITRKILDSRLAEAGEVLSKMKIHKDNLRDSMEKVASKHSRVTEAIKKIHDQCDGRILDPADFLTELLDL